MAATQEAPGSSRRSLRVPELILAAAIGLVIGIGSYTFIYAKGSSYLTDDPAACANCHIMREQFDGWIKSSHRATAVCNDCHTPAGIAAKYTTKALNGFWHSFAFTTGRFPEPLHITARNLRISEQSCRKCHEDIVEAIEGPHRGAAQLSCTRCHSDVGHL
jgi:cytochrome c nitrite reductase small subunit